MNPLSSIPTSRIVIIVAIVALLIGLVAVAFFIFRQPNPLDHGPREEVAFNTYLCPDGSRYLVVEGHGSIQIGGQQYTATAEDPTRYVGDMPIAFVKTDGELTVEDVATGEQTMTCTISSGPDTDPVFDDRSVKRSDALPLNN